LRNGKLNELKFKRQHSIGNYIVDFYCASQRLIIEVDGKIHETKEQKERDQFRDENLIDMGFFIMRFANENVLFDMEYVKQAIVNYSNTQTSS
jgi:very-short-patch-repair endonuclease